MNPMMATMGPIMAGCHECILHHAKMHPWVKLEGLNTIHVGAGVY